MCNAQNYTKYVKICWHGLYEKRRKMSVEFWFAVCIVGGKYIK